MPLVTPCPRPSQSSGASGVQVATSTPPSEARGLDKTLWVLVQGSLAARFVALDDGVPQAFDPVRLVHADQPYAPGQRVAPAPGDTAPHQRVQDRPLRHA